jgi:hypothetical protein
LNTEPENQKFEGQLKIPYPNFWCKFLTIITK